MKKDIIPLLPTTGGVPTSNNIIGREELIRQLWGILTIKGFCLFAERRFGKSCVIRKMHFEPEVGFKTMYLSIQGINDPVQFVEALYEYARKHNLFTITIKGQLEEVWQTFTSGVKKVGPLEFSSDQKVWQKKLSYLIHQIIESNKGFKLVILLDEFSLMLDAMDMDDAALLLGFLRDKVHDQFPQELRIVIAGSIGIDLIISKIQKAGYNLGSPLNHLEKVDLVPFDTETAIYFGKCLNEGCGTNLNDDELKYIANVSEGIPFFIDTIFSKIRYLSKKDQRGIDQILDQLINNPDQNSNLDHFYDRISHYYPDKILSHAILNILCKSNKMIGEKEIINKITLKISLSDIKEDLDRLWKDNYLNRSYNYIEGQRYFEFKYNLIKKWWLINKAD